MILFCPVPQRLTLTHAQLTPLVHVVSSAPPHFCCVSTSVLILLDFPSHCNPSAWLPPFLASARFFPCPVIEDGQSCSPLPISGCLIFPLCFSFSLLFQLWRFWSLPSWTLCPCRWTPTKSISFWSRFTVSFCSSALGPKCGTWDLPTQFSLMFCSCPTFCGHRILLGPIYVSRNLYLQIYFIDPQTQVHFRGDVWGAWVVCWGWVFRKLMGLWRCF